MPLSNRAFNKSGAGLSIRGDVREQHAPNPNLIKYGLWSTAEALYALLISGNCTGGACRY